MSQSLKMSCRVLCSAPLLRQFCAIGSKFYPIKPQLSYSFTGIGTKGCKSCSRYLKRPKALIFQGFRAFFKIGVRHGCAVGLVALSPDSLIQL